MRRALLLRALVALPALSMTCVLLASGAELYEVVDGNKVDAKTYRGWKTWRALACERCHGAQQEGAVGPSLIESMKVVTKEKFHQQVMKGNVEKGMPPFESSTMIQKNWEGLYAYLKGRSEGNIKPGRLSLLGEEADGESDAQSD